MINKGLMIIGTGSGSSKTIFSAGLLRYLWNCGIKTYPFKAISFIEQTKIENNDEKLSNHELGIRYHCKAAKLKFEYDFNPVTVMVKDAGYGDLYIKNNLIYEGVPLMNNDSLSYHLLPKKIREMIKNQILRSLSTLKNSGAFLVVEGASSPVDSQEDYDLVNIFVAKNLNVPIYISNRFSPGGFLSGIVGTISLLPEEIKKRLKGYVISDFYRDEDLSYSQQVIKELFEIPVIGKIPFNKIWRSYPITEEDFENHFNTWAKIFERGFDLKEMNIK